jgi:hypothetical protein
LDVLLVMLILHTVYHAQLVLIHMLVTQTAGNALLVKHALLPQSVSMLATQLLKL